MTTRQPDDIEFVVRRAGDDPFGDKELRSTVGFASQDIINAIRDVRNSAYAFTPASTERVVYVSLGSKASDANDGLSAGAPKATIAGAKAALGSTAGGVIQLLYGTHHFTAADANGNGLTLDHDGQTIKGLGMVLAKIVCDVDLTWGIVAKGAQCEVRDLQLNVTAGKTVTYGIGVTTATSAESCSFTNLLAQPAGGTLTNAFGVSPDAHQDVAETLFENCLARSYTNAGWLIGDDTAANVLNTTMVGCSATHGTYGVRCLGSNFSWYGGAMGYNTGADYYMGTPLAGPTVVDGVRSENSVRLLDTEGPTGGIQNVSLRAITWLGANLNADGKFIRFNHSGSLNIDAVNVVNTGAVVPVIATNANSSLTVSTRGLSMAAPVATAVSKLGSALTVTHIGYTQLDGGTGYVSTTAQYPVPSSLNNGQVFTANGTYTVPATGTYLVEALGGGGGGGGGGTGHATTQAGGGGGAAASVARQMVTLTAGVVLTVTIAGQSAGGTGGAAAGNVGVGGTDGGNTTVVGTGCNVVGIGGKSGAGGAATSAATTAFGVWGYTTRSAATTVLVGGCGGYSSGGVSGAGGGLPIEYAGGGGGGGGSATATNGGGAGTPGTKIAGGNGGANGGSGTLNGVSAADAAATSFGAGGAGGGGGGPTTGVGGDGAKGGPGLVAIRQIA